MKKQFFFGLFVLFLGLGFATHLYAQDPWFSPVVVETLWSDNFSDGNYDTNWTWEVTSGTAQVISNELVFVTAGLPYYDAWIYTVGDPAHQRQGNKYAVYYSTKMWGTGTPASVINIKDDGIVQWLVDFYPTNGAIYLLKAVIPAPGQYIKWVTGLSKIQKGANLKVCVQVMVDTIRVKVWTGPFEPSTWDLEYDSAFTTGVLWPGVYVGGWWLSKDTLSFDNFVVVNLAGTSVEEDRSSEEAEGFSLSQNYPNPFNSSTDFAFILPQAQKVRLEIYNLLGQKVRTLVDEAMTQGTHFIEWDGKDDQGNVVASSIFFYRMEAGAFKETKRMLFLK